MAEQDSFSPDQLLSAFAENDVSSQPSPSNKWAQERDKLYNGSITPINPAVNSDVIGSILTGTPDPINARTGTTENFADGIVDMVNSSSQWANDPNSYAQPFAYGAGWRAGNFERYYSSPSFKKLGYFPGRDNEAIYNENTGFLGDFARMVPQMAGLTVDAFTDMASEWGSWGVDNPDTSMAEDFSKRMAVGMSGKGGVGGFITNLGLNLAYPIGIMTEMFAEDMALTALTAVTFGADAEVTLPTMAIRTGEGFKKIFQSLKDIGKIREGFKSTYDAVRNIRNVENARDFIKFAKLGKVGDFINPFESTTKFIRDYDKLKGLGDWAKTSRGAYALYRDARFINAVTGEAKLEAGFRKVEQTNELINDYYDKNGKLPSGDDLKAIEQNAADASFAVGLTNIPMIFLTDKIVFDTALKGSKFLRAPEEVAAEELSGYGKKIIIENGVTPKVVKTMSVENLQNIFTPKGLASRSMRYLGKNFAEGIQETSQDIIQSTFNDYYSHVYKDPTAASMASSLGVGLTSQMNGQGLETFLSGFFMGGALGVVGGTLFNGILPMGKKIFARKQYDKWVQAKENYINNFVNTYTDLVKNPNKYNSSLRGLDSVLVRSKEMARFTEVLGLDSDSVKEVIDSQDEQAFHTIIDFIEAGHGEHLTTLLDAFKGKTNDELANMFGVDPNADDAGADAKKRLEVFEKRINLAKKLWTESFRDIANPIDIKKAQQEGDLERIKTWEHFEMYRKLAVFHFYALQRAVDRQESIYKKILSDPTMGFAPSSSISPLLSLTSLNQHITTLQAEIDVLDTVDPKEQKRKKEELKLYLEYREKLEEHFKDYIEYGGLNLVKAEMLHGEDNLLELKQNAFRKSKKSKKAVAKVHNKIVRRLAKENNSFILDRDINNAFSLIHDHLILGNDINDINNIADMLINPEHVRELTKRWLPAVTSHIQANKFNYYREGLEKFFSKQAIDTLTKELAHLGVVIPEDQLIKLQAPGLGPINQVIDLVTNKRIGLTEGKGLEAKKIIDEFIEQFTAPKEEGEGAETPETKPEDTGVGPEVVTTPPPPVPDNQRIPTDVPLAKYPSKLYDLRDKLKAAYDKELERRKADNEPEISEETFLEGPIALNIMDEYYEAQEQKTAPATPAPAPAATTTPTPTPVQPAPVSDIEAEKAKITDSELKEVIRLAKFFLENPNEPTTVGSVVSKYPALFKAVTDIEKRRQASLRDITQTSLNFDAGSGYVTQYYISSTEIIDSNGKPSGLYRDYEIIKEDTKEEIEKEVNAKYDAELEALKGKPEEKPTKTTLPIASKYKGSIVYATPGSGKTWLFQRHDNFIDSDELLRLKMEANSMPMEPGETLGQASFRYWKSQPDRMKRIYEEVLSDMKKFASLGFTVLTGTRRFIPEADHVIISEDNEALAKNIAGGMTVEEYRDSEDEYLGNRPFEMLTKGNTLYDKLTEESVPEGKAFSPFEMLSEVTTLSELDKAWKEVSQHYTNTLTVIPDEIDKLYQNKLKQLTKDLTADTVKVGDKVKIKNNFRSARKTDIILLWGGNIVEVVKKTDKGVYVQRTSLIPSETAKAPIYLTNNQFNNIGASLYDEQVSEQAISTPETVNEEVANKNGLSEEDVKNTSNLIDELRSDIDPNDEPPTADEC